MNSEVEKKVSPRRLLYLMLFVWTFGPVLSVLLAMGIAFLGGGSCSEAEAHPCWVFGYNIGDLLYCMFVFGWMAIITLPTGILAMFLLSIGSFLSKTEGCDGQNKTPEPQRVKEFIFLSWLLAGGSIFFPWAAIAGVLYGFLAWKRMGKNPNPMILTFAVIAIGLGILRILFYIISPWFRF